MLYKDIIRVLSHVYRRELSSHKFFSLGAGTSFLWIPKYHNTIDLLSLFQRNTIHLQKYLGTVVREIDNSEMVGGSVCTDTTTGISKYPCGQSIRKDFP